MRLEFVKAFVEITQEIFSEVLSDHKVATGQLSLEWAPRVEGAVVTYIELSGDLLGKILLYMEYQTASAIATRMLGKSLPSQQLVASCIAELAGMAVGRVISWINDKACHIQMSPPIITIDTRVQAPSEGVETLIFPIQTTCGEATLNVSFVDLDYSAEERTNSGREVVHGEEEQTAN
ncbi:MAG: chemotaxis protein CheX [Acidobacteriota bacterium]